MNQGRRQEFRAPKLKKSQILNFCDLSETLSYYLMSFFYHSPRFLVHLKLYYCQLPSPIFIARPLPHTSWPLHTTRPYAFPSPPTPSFWWACMEVLFHKGIQGSI